MTTQTLHAVDYQGGQILVDWDSPINVGDKIIHGNICAYNHSIRVVTDDMLNGANEMRELFRKERDKPNSPITVYTEIIVAQSTNLSLEGIPYVEIEEDIQSICNTDCCTAYNDSDNPQYFNPRTYEKGWKKGYKAKSAKKYTEEDLRNALKILDESAFIQESSEHYTMDCVRFNKSFDEIIQSLQPKVVSIEVETKETGAVCETCNRQGVRHCAYPEECGAWTPILTPAICVKDDKTFLNVIKINYE